MGYAMSWHFLDGPLRQQQRTAWVVPEHLRQNPRASTGSFHRPTDPDPDKLMQYIDNAISVTEFAQATGHSSLLHGSSPSSPSMLSPPLSSSLAAETGHLTLLNGSSQSSLSTSSSSSLAAAGAHQGKKAIDDSSVIPPLLSQHKVSHFKFAPPLPQEYINSLLERNMQEDITLTSRESNVMVAQENPSVEADGSLLQTFKEDYQEKYDTSNNADKSGKGEEYDIRAAENTYKAACCALFEGDADLALSLLQVVLAKCPPDKPNALAKVHRLMGDAGQLVERNRAVLRSLPAERDLL